MVSKMFGFLFLGLLLALAKALTLPKHLSMHEFVAENVVKRNATVAATQQMSLNIDPDIVNPICGGIVQANINIDYAPDPFYLTAACNNVLSFLGGPKGNKDVDIIFTCTGQPTTGVGDRDVKVILSTAPKNSLNANDRSIQRISANMEVVSEKDNFIMSTGVQLGFKVETQDGTSNTIAQFIFC